MMQCNSLIVPTLKIEIMKTIKQIVFCVSLLLVMNCFYSCLLYTSDAADEL